jgi:DNA-binding SARP family transcriptional activator
MDQRRTDAIPHVQELQQRGHPSQQQDVAMMPTVSARMRPVRTTRSTLGPTMQVWIGILGPLQVRVGSGEPVEVVGPRLRTLLIRLALDPGRVVLVDQLVDAVWDEDPPAGATNALQSLVARLRRQLPDVVQTHQAGYRLAVDPDAVDAVRFQGLAAAGRRQLAGDPWHAGRTLREALGLWRGPALADAATARFAAAVVTRLEERRLGAVEDRIEADLATGDHEAALAELDELVTAHPLRERPHGQLMRTLAAAGRQADALAAYQQLRRRLADELGIDPSAELQALHVAVLRGEAAPPADPPRGMLRAGPSPDGPELGAAPAVSWTNLRTPKTSFVGRGDDLARIAAALRDARLVTLWRRRTRRRTAPRTSAAAGSGRPAPWGCGGSGRGCARPG